MNCISVLFDLVESKGIDFGGHDTTCVLTTKIFISYNSIRTPLCFRLMRVFAIGMSLASLYYAYLLDSFFWADSHAKNTQTQRCTNAKRRRSPHLRLPLNQIFAILHVVATTKSAAAALAQTKRFNFSVSSVACCRRRCCGIVATSLSSSPSQAPPKHADWNGWNSRHANARRTNEILLMCTFCQILPTTRSGEM